MSHRARRERRLLGDGTAPMGGAGMGYDAWKAAIGDKSVEGKLGFHDTALRAALAYFCKNGSGADAEWVRADLEAAMRAAPWGGHGADEIERRIADLPRQIQWAADRRADDEAERGEHAANVGEGEPAELAPFATYTRSGERAGRITRRLARIFFDKAEAWLEARDWAEDFRPRQCRARSDVREGEAADAGNRRGRRRGQDPGGDRRIPRAPVALEAPYPYLRVDQGEM
jgi:hypothetical protein